MSMFFQSWRSYPGALVVIAWLCVGMGLEAFRSKVAKYVNLTFYAVFVAIWFPALFAIFRGRAEPGAMAYVVTFGGPALLVLVVDWFLYRNAGGKVQPNE